MVLLWVLDISVLSIREPSYSIYIIKPCVVTGVDGFYMFSTIKFTTPES
jgi:hypothetical protein